MKFSYNWLKEFVPIKGSPNNLAEFLTLRAFEVEGVEKKGSDAVLDIKLLPNRVADAAGHRGMAREIATLQGLRIRNKELGIKEDKKQRARDILEVKIENAEDCPRYTARAMTDIRVGPSPAWLRERIEICGLQSINNIVDATNYVMLESGQPLHAFDFEKLAGTGDKKTIVVRRARAHEGIETLDGKTYMLTPDILLITDGAEPLAIAGIKGGMASGITHETKTIVIESANFNQIRVRAASQALKLKTDASYRFEHGMDPNETLRAVDAASALIQKIAGGVILSGAIDVYPKRAAASKILFRVPYANSLMGTSLPSSFFRSALLRLGCSVVAKGKDALLVRPPTIRRDLAIEEDLVEEAARILGYENIPARHPSVITRPAQRNEEHWWEDRVRDFASGAGFTETMLYSFTGDRELGQFLIDPMTAPELENPMNPETKYLTPRAITKYTASAAENLRHTPDLGIFGIAKSFQKIKDGIQEEKELIFVLARAGGAGEEEFYELKGVIDRMFEALGIDDAWYDDAPETRDKKQETKMFHPYRIAEIKIGDEAIGIIGEIHPAALKNLKCRERIVTSSIRFSALVKAAENEAEFQPIGKYPAVIRDIALVVPDGTKTETVMNVIEGSGGTLLVDTDLFDYFQDDNMRGRAEKSLAFHLVFQSPERTLTDTEVDTAIKHMISALEEKNWAVKK